MLRIILAEADPEARAAVLAVLRSDRGIEVLGLPDDGREVVAMTARLRPDLVLMGVRLRTLDGLRATTEIMIESPTPILLLGGQHTANEIDLTVRALSAGALSVIAVPQPGDNTFSKKRSEFVSTLKAMSEVKLVRRWRERRRAAAGPSGRAGPIAAHIVAIASSTGGPAVLETILSHLPKDFPAPILVVQHIAPGFLEGMASWLDQASNLSVKVAQHGDCLSDGTVYFAPDDRHLGVSRTGRILLSRDPPVGGFRPSATFLFESVARSFGRNALAVILSGMGRDGVEGLRAVRGGGGRVVAQDEASCVVFGMPKVAIEEGLVDHVLPVGEIDRLLLGSVMEQGGS